MGVVVTTTAKILPRLALAFGLVMPQHADAAFSPADRSVSAEKTLTATAINIDNILQGCTETGQVASTKVSLTIGFDPANSMPTDEALHLRSKIMSILTDGWKQQTASITPSDRRLADTGSQKQLAEETLAGFQDRVIERILALPEIAAAAHKDLIVRDFFIERTPNACRTNFASQRAP